MAGGRCVPLSLSFLTPAPLEVFDAGALVPVSVRARLFDGGSHSVMIPLSSSFGPQSALTSGATSLIPLPATAGVHRFTAGWDGGPRATVDVVAVSCVVACQPWQACRATSDGGVCESLNLTLSFVTPDAGLVFNTASVPARLSVARATGPIPASLTSIPLFGQIANNTTVPGSLTPLSGSGSTFTGALPLFVPDGVKTFVAGWPDGGPVASLLVNRDTTPPDVRVELLPRPSSAPDPDPDQPQDWKKLERALVRVIVDGGRPAVATDLQVVNAPGVTLVQVASSACGCTACQCFELPLQSVPDHTVSRAILRVSSIADSVGNASAPVDEVFYFTRFLWRRAVTDTNAISVTENGVIVVQHPNGLQAIYPDAGLGWAWSAPSGSQLEPRPPVISATSVFVIERTSSLTTLVRRIGLATGAETGAFCAEDRQSPPRVALATSALGIEVPVVLAKPSLTIVGASCPSIEVNSVTSNATLATARESTGEAGFFVVGDGSLHKLAFDGVNWADGGTYVTPTTVSWLFMTQGGIGTASPNLITLAPTSDVGDVSGQPNGTLVPLVAAAGTLFGFWNQSIIRVPYTGTTLSSPLATMVQSVGPPSMLVVGETALYGNIQLGFVPELARLPLDAGVRTYGREAQAFAVDVLRTASGAKVCGLGLGVAYSLDGSGYLTATVIDGQGLDRTAPWPAPLHDSANSSNFDRSLVPWSCP